MQGFNDTEVVSMDGGPAARYNSRANHGQNSGGTIKSQHINQNHFEAAIAFVWFGEVVFEVDTGKAAAPET